MSATSPCPVCGGTSEIIREYEGFDGATISVWTCANCARTEKIANPPKTPGQEPRKPTDETVHDGGNEEVEG